MCWQKRGEKSYERITAGNRIAWLAMWIIKATDILDCNPTNAGALKTQGHRKLVCHVRTVEETFRL